MDSGLTLYLGVNASFAHSSLAGNMLRVWTEKKMPEWKWVMLEATIKSDSVKVVNEIVSNKPDVIVATTYLFNRNFLLPLLRNCHDLLPAATIVLGGPEFNGDNMNFLRQNSYISAVSRGDESSFHLLLDNLIERENWKNIPGLCYLSSAGGYVDNGSAEFSGNLDLLPSVYSSEYLSSNKPFYQLETVRGCAGKCIFCSSAGKQLKFHSIQRVVDDLKMLHKHGIREVRILDRTFNHPESRAIELLDVFYHEFHDMQFHLEISPAFLGEKFLAKIGESPANMLHLEVGIQTLCDESLMAICRAGTALMYVNNLKKLRQIHHIKIHADLIAGLPCQDYCSIIDDVLQLMALQVDEIQLERLKVLPGSTMHLNPWHGIIYNQETPYQVCATDKLTSEDLLALDQISQTIDGWYNCSQLKSSIQFANIHIQGFLEEFIAFLKTVDYFSGMGRGDLVTRFDLLEKYASVKSIPLYELVVFSRIAAGLFINNLESKINPSICLAECKEIWRKTVPDKYRARKYLESGFNYNVAELWANPETTLNGMPSFCIFELYYGRNVSAIYQKCNS